MLLLVLDQRTAVVGVRNPAALQKDFGAAAVTEVFEPLDAASTAATESFESGDAARRRWQGSRS